MRLIVTALLSFFFSAPLFAAESVYCPQNHGYINTGMTKAEVLQSCGHPWRKTKSDQPVTKKVAVKQLIYNHQDAVSVFYGVHAISTGYGGVRLEVDIIDNKVASIRVNGTSSNAFSVCGDQNIQIGEAAAVVFNACGSPSVVNNTFIRKLLPGNNEAEQWIYDMSDYQTNMRLTFVNGHLQSIDQ